VGDPPVISWFDTFEGPNEYAYLSNFYVGAPLHFGPYTYLTGEHMFQAFKATNKRDHMRIVVCATPAEAKATGKRVLRLRPDWERVKFDVMRLVLATKFRMDRAEGALLVATGDALLVEGTMWGDQVWGVDLKAGRARAAAENRDGEPWEPGEGWAHSPGRNWLGVLLMARRCELVAQSVLGVPTFDYTSTAAVATTLPRPVP
jgi:ribA/ribD-fused uncharacterized protein